VPVYEYVCQDCQHRFEVKQKMSDAPLTSCTRCGQPVTKVISASAIMFKGSGWYVTDYSDKMKPPTDSKPTEDSKPAEAAKGSNGQPESKSAPVSPAPASGGTSEGTSGGTSGSSSGGTSSSGTTSTATPSSTSSKPPSSSS
jgi:putative FmdB family regulatory protein